MSDSLANVTTPQPPIAAQPPLPTYPTRPPSNGRAIILQAVVGLIALAALVVGIIALVRSGSSGAGAIPASAPPSPTIAAADAVNAKKDLCAAYELAARAVKIDTHSSDPSLARISLTNGASMLESSAANPALNASDRDAARALATAYRTSTAVSSGLDDPASPLYQRTIDDINRADAAMAGICR